MMKTKPGSSMHTNGYFHTSLQKGEFSIEKQHDTLQQACQHSGAIVTFTGLVRDLSKSRTQVNSIELSIYKAMTQKQLHDIGSDIFERFDIDGLDIIHRYGKLTPMEKIVYIGVASKHRAEAFNAAQMTMDILKSNVAFWKKEHYVDDTPSQWIEPSQNDHKAIQHWMKK